MAYKSNSSKFWTGFLAVLLALVLAGTAAPIGVLSDGFKNWDKFKTDEEQTEQTEETTAAGGAIIGESIGSGIKITSAKIAMADYADNGISSMAETAYQLRATVTPDSATNKAVDWSVSFVDPSSGWANGKDVSDYVTVTPVSDGALTANVECLQAFASQIKVTVSSRENPQIKAECTVDYAMRCPSPTFSTGGFSVPGYGLFSPISFSKDSSTISLPIYPDFTETGKNKITFTNFFVTYTLPDTFTATYQLKISEDLKGLLTVHSILGDDLIDVTEDFTPNRSLFEKMFGDNVYGNSEKMDDLVTDLSLCDVDFTIEISLVGTYSQEHFSIPLNIDTSKFTIDISSIVFDKTQLVF